MAFIGTVIGGNSGEVATATPTPTVTITQTVPAAPAPAKTVTVTKTEKSMPAPCLDALGAADGMLRKNAQLLNTVGDIFDHLDTVGPSDLSAVSSDEAAYEKAVKNYASLRDACKAAL